MARTKIAEIQDLPPGAATCVDAAGRTLALFNVDGACMPSTTRARTAAGLSARVISTAPS